MKLLPPKHPGRALIFGMEPWMFYTLLAAVLFFLFFLFGPFLAVWIRHL